MAKKDSKTFPNKIRQYRNRAGLTLEELGFLVGCSHATIHALETGKQDLDIEWMRKIAAVFEVAPSELLLDGDRGSPLTDGEAQLVHAYRTASPDRQTLMSKVIAVLAI